MKKTIVAILLCVFVFLLIFPVTAMAAETTSENTELYLTCTGSDNSDIISDNSKSSEVVNSIFYVSCTLSPVRSTYTAFVVLLFMLLIVLLLINRHRFK
jgi:uncharacterized secreted protein with C-terminal beta-propeller domain